MIVDIEVHDEAPYNEYKTKVQDIVKKYGGRYRVRGGRISPVSGEWTPERIVLLEFDTMEHLQACFRSREYAEIAPLREKSTSSRSIVVEGVED